MLLLFLYFFLYSLERWIKTKPSSQQQQHRQTNTHSLLKSYMRPHMHIEILYRTVKRETAGGREIKYDLIIPHTEKRKIIRKTVRKMKRMHHTNCNKLCKKNKKMFTFPFWCILILWFIFVLFHYVPDLSLCVYLTYCYFKSLFCCHSHRLYLCIYVLQIIKYS